MKAKIFTSTASAAEVPAASSSLLAVGSPGLVPLSAAVSSAPATSAASAATTSASELALLAEPGNKSHMKADPPNWQQLFSPRGLLPVTTTAAASQMRRHVARLALTSLTRGLVLS